MICDSPLTAGPDRGQPARGTSGGYARHMAAGEAPCEDCRRNYNRDRRDRRAGIPRITPGGRNCAICGVRLSEHVVGRWCRPTAVEEVTL